MGENVDTLPEAERPFAFIKALQTLIAAVGLAEETLSAYGVKESDIPAMAQNARTAMGSLFACTPVPQGQADIERIFMRAYR